MKFHMADMLDAVPTKTEVATKGELGGQAMSRTALAWSVTLMAAAFATALAWGHQPLSVALMAAALITPTYLDQEETTHD